MINVRVRNYIISGLFILLTLIGSVAFIYYWEDIKQFGGYGYPFIFLISFVAGSSLPFPAPYVMAVFSMASVLPPFLVGMVSGIGAGIGGMVVYYLGRSGRNLFSWGGSFQGSDSTVARWTERINRWARHRGSLVVFIMSVTFNPAFGPMSIAIGAMRFSSTKFFIMCTLGSVVKSLIIAYCGYYGLGSLLRWLGVVV